MENNKKKNKLPKLIGIIGILVLVFGITYAIFTVTLNGTKKVKIKTGTINLRLLDKDNNYVDELNPDADTGFDIKLENAVPMSHEEALERDDNIYTFKVKNEGTINTEYSVLLEDLELETGEERIDDRYIGYEIKREDIDVSEDWTLGELGSRKVDFGLIEPNQVYTYTLRLWVDESAGNTEMNKTFYAHIKLDGVQTNKESEVSLSITNLKATKVGTASYTEPSYTKTDNSFTINNLNANLYSIGDKVTYSFTLKNDGLYDLYLDGDITKPSYIFETCYDRGSYSEHPECEKWDFDYNGTFNGIDAGLYLSTFNGRNFDITKKVLKSGETINAISQVEFVKYNDQRPQADQYEFFGKDMTINYERNI